jgi:hypothetical protein
MDKNKSNTVPVGIRFMGRSLGELLELKAKCRRRLEFLDKNKARISAYVYEKLRQEYRSYLDAVDGEVSVRLCDYEVKLAEIRVFSNQLGLLKKSFSDKIQEIELRYNLGEYDKEKFELLCRDYKERMEHFEQGITKYSGEQQRIRQFLDQVYGDGSETLKTTVPETGREKEPESIPKLEIPEPQAGDELVPAESPAVEQPPVTEQITQSAAEELPEESLEPERFSEQEDVLLIESEVPGQLQSTSDLPDQPETSKPGAGLLENVETVVPDQSQQEISLDAAEEPEDDSAGMAGVTPEPETTGVDLSAESESMAAPDESDLAQEPEKAPGHEVVGELPGLKEIKEEAIAPDYYGEEKTEIPEMPKDTIEEEPAAVESEQPAAETAVPFDLEEVMLGAGEAAEPEAEPAAVESEQPAAETAAPVDLEEVMLGAGEAADLAGDQPVSTEAPEPCTTEAQETVETKVESDIAALEADMAAGGEVPQSAAAEESEPAGEGTVGGDVSIEDDLAESLNGAEAPQSAAAEKSEPAGEGTVGGDVSIEDDLAESLNGTEAPQSAAAEELETAGEGTVGGDVSIEDDLAESLNGAEAPPPQNGDALDLDEIMSAAGTGNDTAALPTVEPPVKDKQESEISTDSLHEEVPETVEQPAEIEKETSPEPVVEDQEPKISYEPVKSEPNGGDDYGEPAVLKVEESAQSPEEKLPAGEQEANVEEDTMEESMPPSGGGQAVSLSLDEKLAISLDIDQMGEESQVLSVNQTIDAIKKKTVKCPVCSTMNYAIRWYCENCEATLTAL